MNGLIRGGLLVIVMTVVIAVAGCAHDSTGDNPAGASSGRQESKTGGGKGAADPAAIGLKVTHYQAGLYIAYGVSGVVDGTIGGHRVLAGLPGQNFDGFELDSDSCKVESGHVYATGRLTNTFKVTADFSVTAEILNKDAAGSLMSQIPVGVPAFQIYKLPPGQSVLVKAVGDVTGEASGPRYGCTFYKVVAADSHAVSPY
jgi:hypothetical protein